MPKASILIVDDERAIRSLAALHFESAGYDVRTAVDALEAMKICSSEFFDAVLSDVTMPGPSGHEFARWLAHHHPATCCVLMTGADTGCGDCPIAGRCTIITKPFLPKDAVVTIGRVLEMNRGRALSAAR